MPRAPKPPKPPDLLKPPPRAVCDAICRRFLKEGTTIFWAREMSAFYRVWKRYPSVPFWQAYELPFGNHSLNMMSWFERGEGPAELERAWVLFHYNPPNPEAINTSTLDIGGQAEDTSPVSVIPSPVVIPSRPRTVAEMMKG